MSHTVPTEKPRPWLAEGSTLEALDVLLAIATLRQPLLFELGNVPLDQPVRRGHHGVDRGLPTSGRL